MPVDQYIGGVEHAILHLMYARFFTKALADLGYLSVQEPFARLFTQGMITRDGAKMSKSQGQRHLARRRYIERYGADTARAYILFIGPPDQDADWSDAGVEGVHRFLARLWRMSAETAGQTPDDPLPDELSEADEELLRKAHWAIEKVTNDMAGRFAFNTAIAAVMELTNDDLHAARATATPSPGALRFALATAASLLFPFAPHTAADAYELLTGRRVWEEPWPAADQRWLERDTFELVVPGQRQGPRPRPGADERGARGARGAGLGTPKVQAHIDGKDVVKVIVVPQRWSTSSCASRSAGRIPAR